MKPRSKPVTDLSSKRRALLLKLIDGEGLGSRLAERIPVRDDPSRAPLSFAQIGLWLTNELNPDSSAYNDHFARRLTGALNVPCLSQAVAEIISRHQILRAVFKTLDLEPAQVFGDPFEPPIPIADLRWAPAGVIDDLALKLAAEEARRPFDLASVPPSPLIRMLVIRLHEADSLLLLTIPHIVTDGWSHGVLVRELNSLYDSFFTGSSSRLKPLSIQYGDYAQWQRERIKEEALREQIEYWTSRLSGAPPLEILTDRPRAEAGGRAARHSFALPPGLTARINELGRRQDKTVFMILLAAYQSLLARYGGQDDVSVGSPIAGRGREETEELIGPFVNTLVFRADLSHNPTVARFLDQTRDACIDGFAHQDLPFERLVEELKPRRRLDQHPLFQAAFALQNAPMEPLNLSGTAAAPVDAAAAEIKFDLTLTATAPNETIEFSLEYGAEMFDARTMERFAENLQKILEGMIAVESQRILEIPLLTGAERDEVMLALSGTTSAYPVNQSIPQVFESWSNSTPDAIAVVYEDEQLTYSTLNRGANQLGRYLQSAGVRPEVTVGLFIERSTDMVTALLGVLKAGGAYAPFDRGYPPARLRYMIKDSGAAVLLTDEPLDPDLNDQSARVICLRECRNEISRRSDNNYDSGATPDSLAYLMYTSGSTGEPKGVAATHRNVVKLVKGADYVELNSSEVILQFAPISFDASTFEIWGSLLNGGRLVVHPAVFQSVEQLGSVLARSQVTTLWLTAGLFHQIIDERVEALSGLHQLLAGGDVLSPVHVSKALEELPHCAIINGYGPTEGVTFTCCHPISRLSNARLMVPIGRPISNSKVYLLDRRLLPVPPGVAGELFIAGDGLSRGYFERPELTAEKFVASPFAAEGTRLYRTGDMARLRGNGGNGGKGGKGVIEFLGRTDNQVKLRGFRIELGEVEAVMMGHAAVKAAIAVIKDIDDDEGDKRLIAYVVPRAGGGSIERQLAARLRSALPEYLVPSAIVELQELPLTANGKVDKAALPDPKNRRTDGERRPRTLIEASVAAIWSDVLKIEQPRLNDDFFELGGHSLLATRIASRLEKTFGIELGLRAIFENPTLELLSAQVEARMTRGDLPEWGNVQQAIVSRDKLDKLETHRETNRYCSESEAPLSSPQQRLWFLDQLSPGTPAYNVAAAFRIKGAFSASVFEQAINELVRRHEVLRTSFLVRDGQPLQVISQAVRLAIKHIDLTGIGRAEQEAAALAAREAARPFDLERPPLIRLALMTLGGDEVILLVTMHHIICDEWSLGILVREVSQSYGAFRIGAPMEIEDLTIQYADYAVWQRRRLSEDILQGQIRYWTTQFEDLDSFAALPADHQKPIAQGARASTERLMIEPSIGLRLESLAKREGATLFMSLLSAASCLLYHYTGEEDVVFGSPVASRNRPELDDLIGFFDNTVPIRLAVRGDKTIRDVLLAVRTAALGAYANQDLPFDRLVEEVRPYRGAAQTPLFQILFVMKNPPAAWLEIENVVVEEIDVEPAAPQFDLMLFAEKTGAGIKVSVEYDNSLFDQATIKRLLTHLDRVAAAMAENFDGRVSEIAMLTEAERLQLSAWNDTEIQWPAASSVAVMLERSWSEYSDSVALQDRDQFITYAMLDRLTALAASRLLSLGVGTESLIGLYIPRGIEMVVGLLAVIKAGAAYVPLDTNYPRERIEFMIEDSSPALVLTLKPWADAVDSHGARVIYIEETLAEAAESGVLCAAAQPQPDNLAYVIYTSGSTGKPKGIAMTQGCLFNLICWQAARWRNRPGARTIQYTSLSFDVSYQEIVSTLWTGGTLILIDEMVRRDPVSLWRELKEKQVERLFAPYVALKQLASEAGSNPAVAAPSLTQIITAGEALHINHDVERLVEATGCAIDNQYGPSESHIVTAGELTGEPREWPRKPPIGIPIANGRMYMLRDCIQPVPAGISAELCIGGAVLGRCYLNRPDLTAERFRPDPYSPDGGRLYRTGDEARYGSTGDIDFVGRMDGQVKIRGYRVEVGEIEATLRQQPGVREAVVIVKGDDLGIKRLIAYAVVNNGAGNAFAVDERLLKDRLKQKLPDFMVPSQIAIVPDLPKTPSGKLDRRRLPEVAPVEALDLDSRATQTQQILRGVWESVLGLRGIEAHQSFFDLGGHSLLATQVVSRIRQAFKIDLPLQSIFEEPTLAALADRIELERLAGAGIEPAAPIARAPRDRALPLSFQQESLWFMSKLAPDNAAYNMRGGLKLSGPLRTAPFDQALDELLRRHEALRTNFTIEEGKAVQVLRAAPRAVLKLVDLSALSDKDQTEQIDSLNARQAERPFDLAVDSMIRCSLMRLGKQVNHLAFTIHHIAIDGWSIGIINNEISQLYAAYASGRPSTLAEPEVQYGDYAAWQRRSLEDGRREILLEYWRNRLEGLNRLDLPTDRPRGAAQTFRGSSASTLLSSELSEQVQSLSRGQGVTLFMTLLAAFKVVLSAYTSQFDIAVGADIAHRNRPEIESTLGLFTNQLVLRTDLSGDPKFRELLDRVREVTLGAYAHQDLPFESLVKELHPDRKIGENPLFQVMFILQNAPIAPLTLQGLTIEPLPLSEQASPFDISLVFEETNGRFSLSARYNTDLFEEKTVSQTLCDIDRTLRHVVEDPDRRLSDLRALIRQERRQTAPAFGRKRRTELRQLI